jgi:hypothetical protein
MVPSFRRDYTTAVNDAIRRTHTVADEAAGDSTYVLEDISSATS